MSELGRLTRNAVPLMENQKHNVRPPAEDPRLAYTIAVLLSAMQADSATWPEWLRYGDETEAPGKGVLIVRSRFFDDLYGTPASLPPLPLAEIEGVPLLYGRPLVERRDKALIVHADVVASAYFLLTRYEEWVRRDVRDGHGRFPGVESLPARAGFLDRPVVDEYAALLRKWARQAGIDVPEPERRFSVLLTHDVDSLGPRPGPVGTARACVAGLLGRRLWRRALGDAMAAAGLVRHPADNLDDVLRLDRRLTDRFSADRCRSAFFFLAGGTSAFDENYRLHSRRVQHRLREVASSDAEVGLHASYSAGIEPQRVANEHRALQEAVGRTIDKNRHHFLGWREPEDGWAIAEAGIRWDSTLGYADRPGFRLGVCRPIPLFDPIRRRPLGIEEHPLVVMDCTLDRPDYLHLDEESAFACVRRLADATCLHRGEFVCLWHNTALASNDTGYHRRLYPRVLDYLGRLLEDANNEGCLERIPPGEVDRD